MKKKIFISAVFLIYTFAVRAQWSAITPVPAGGVGNDGAVSFSIGSKGYLIAGSATSNIYAFDSVTHAWSFVDSVPVNMGHSFGMSFVINGKGYVVGGDTSGVPQSSVWEFDPAATGSLWTQKNDFTGGPRDAGFGFSIGNSGYIGAGNDNVGLKNDIWKYNPAADSWTQLTTSLPIDLIFPTSFVIGNKGYIVTGGTSPSGINEVKKMWCLDGTNDSLSVKADFGGVGRQAAFAFSNNYYGFVGGGQANYTTNFNDMWLYNAATDHWTQSTNAPLLGAAWSSAFVIGNTAYAGLGAKFLPSGALTGNLSFYKFNINFGTGTPEMNDHESYAAVFPNPASGLLKIESGKNEKLLVEIYSSLGEKVLSKQVENAEAIEVEYLSAGMYFVKISSGNHGMTVKKIQILR